MPVMLMVLIVARLGVVTMRCRLGAVSIVWPRYRNEVRRACGRRETQADTIRRRGTLGEA